MKCDKRRRVLAILLLVVYMPAFVGMAFHSHDEGSVVAAVECADCSQHSPHHVHLVQQEIGHDCFLCRFAQMVFAPVFSLFVLCILLLECFMPFLALRPILSRWTAVGTTRAPPCF